MGGQWQPVQFYPGIRALEGGTVFLQPTFGLALGNGPRNAGRRRPCNIDLEYPCLAEQSFVE